MYYVMLFVWKSACMCVYYANYIDTLVHMNMNCIVSKNNVQFSTSIGILHCAMNYKYIRIFVSFLKLLKRVRSYLKVSVKVCIRIIN